MRILPGSFAMCLLVLPLLADPAAHASNATLPDRSRPPRPAQAVVTNWTTSEGAMTLQQVNATMTGTYTQDDGRISLTLTYIGHASHDRWTGWWGEANSQQRCSDQMLGTYYWGRLTVQFSDEHRHFDAQWSYCDAEPPAAGASWTGDLAN